MTITKTDITADTFRHHAEQLGTPAVAELFVSALDQHYGERGLDCFIDLAGLYRDVFGNDYKAYHPKDPIEPAEAERVAKAVIEWANNPDKVKAYFDLIDQIENPEAYYSTDNQP
jgi:hypothetical protein